MSDVIETALEGMQPEQEVVAEMQPTDAPVETVSEAPAREFSPKELEQMAKGWNPNGPKSAEQYEADGKLYEEIKRSHRENKEIKEALFKTQKILNEQATLQYEKALADIRAGRIEAIRMGDVDAVASYDEAMLVNQKKLNDLKAENVAPVITLTPEQEQCVAKHADIYKFEDKSWAADQIRDEVFKKEQKLIAQGLDVNDIVKIIDNDITMMKKVLMPEKVEAAPSIPKFNPVAPNMPTMVADKPKRISFSQLPDQIKRDAYNAIKVGLYKSENEFIEAQYKYGVLK